ncbi:MAG: hypothetical protein Pg6B_09290 [Candidatus Azobacteroides pseudotrichonymphae]|jgi:hypothetical protein|nr:MAG: hypothetical protein Pg6B_09290 [Candidatus Azobacteroides pseudotrichonymphae]
MIETIEDDLLEAKAIKKALAFAMNEFVGLATELEYNNKRMGRYTDQRGKLSLERK